MSEAGNLAGLNHIKDLESRYDSAMAVIRGIASGWLLASLGAIGSIIVTGAGENAAFGPAYLVFLTAAAGVSGLLLLWYLDSVVYQGLFHAAFAYGLYIEYLDRSVPQIRSAMHLAWEDNAPRLALYYLAPIRLLALLGVASIPSAAIDIGAQVDSATGALPDFRVVQAFALVLLPPVIALFIVLVRDLAQRALLEASVQHLPPDFQDYVKSRERRSKALRTLSENQQRGI